MASETGRLSIALITRGILRALPLSVRWPASAARMLMGGDLAAREARRLTGAYEDFGRLLLAKTQHECLSQVAERSLFRRPCVMQIVRGVLEAEGRVSQKLLAHLRAHFSRASDTQAVEDGFNHMKDDRVMMRRRRLSRPERAITTVIQKGVLAKRHRFREIRPSGVLPKRGLPLPTTLFLPKASRVASLSRRSPAHLRRRHGGARMLRGPLCRSATQCF